MMLREKQAEFKIGLYSYALLLFLLLRLSARDATTTAAAVVLWCPLKSCY